MRKISIFFLIMVILAGLSIWFGCSKENNNVVSPAVESQNAAKMPADVLERVIEVQDKHTSKLMSLPDVVGTAVGLGPNGNPAIFVLTKVLGVAGIPKELDGVPVIVEVTGEISALGKPEGNTKPTNINPKGRFARPVPIGVSTGNEGECSAGTIGCRVTNGTIGYALSNNHVYAPSNTDADIGSQILQPGRYDTKCRLDTNNSIGTLDRYARIYFSENNTIDAAIASSDIDNLGNSTPSNGFGKPKSSTATATLSMPVQKYGRTTALTKGHVILIDATINVSYGTAGIATFINQIVVKGNKPFIKDGDSGSLLVTDPGNNPVGLLFAGSSNGYAFANPIDAVLAAFGVTVDDSVE